jgi:tripartite-type tricarboxylate transporter receptor subunit TctC
VALAVSSAKRQPALPDTPSVAEAALPQYDFMTWYGTVGPAGTPPEIVARLSREIADALNQPDVKQRLATLGVVASPSSPQEFASFLQRETEALGRMVRVTGVKAD